LGCLYCQGAEQTLGGSPSVLCGGRAALHIRFWISGGGLPFQTPAALSASDDFTKTEALKSVRGLPVSEASPNFVDNFIQKSRGFNLDNLGRSGVTKFEAITGPMPFQTLLLSRLLRISQRSMLSKCSGAPIRNSFMELRLLMLLLRIGVPH
jgi:hypothetical protein